MFLTCLTVFLAAFTGLPPITAVVDRLIDNVIGAALVIGATLVWPTWVGTAVPELVAACITAQRRFADAVLDRSSGAANAGDDQLDRLVSRARLARSNAEAAGERMASEPPGRRPLALGAAEGILAQMHRYGLAGLSLRARGPAGPAPGLAVLRPVREGLDASFGALAQAVADTAPCPTAPLGRLGHALRAAGAPGSGVPEAVLDDAAVMAGAAAAATEALNSSHPGGGPLRRR